MQHYNRLAQKLKDLNGFSKTSLKMGLYLMTCFYIVAAAAYIIAPYANNYFGVMGVYRGGLEAAPASLAAGIAAAIICDLALAPKKPGNKPWDKK